MTHERTPYFHILERDPLSPFPAVELAHRDPDGLLAIGGCLAPERLMNAYQHGIFPWFSPGEPILWWSPSTRAVIPIHGVRVNRSLRKFLGNNPYSVTINRSFPAVIHHCATTPRGPGNGVWITPEMQRAYIRLHHLHIAHSVEVWHQEQLVGGLYGVLTKQTFCGESMFSHAPNASKVALVVFSEYLKQIGVKQIDCQIMNPFLQQMGAVSIARKEFLDRLNRQETLEFAGQLLKPQQLLAANVGN
ncbi:leucyl/phenylalanyl-tRNA--protein transferase [Aliidiomarina haloalkalitolerans]|uniref:Leucyl/phenylalanyl-tRNA--protein transferase n=1 Tax=Aliidiomarina haloalkalitolerans TaxID=859059 RepID=A0A432VY45_9GAMM|nr:leucyl/phenylalanyl-tRNA--protein transferase [Aliidiomarina haloalkalitolerans]MCL4409817.1 leucyl/phenylalanyl-tRNA--protein transferase [Gammaproteobacteria bacterium]RUO21612.1 leucyl/phenylalanyl-tRNA--protein transferase [Aliidiomarina haloalkalitolerans]